MVMLSQRREVGEFRKRYKWFVLIAFLVFGGLLGRVVRRSASKRTPPTCFQPFGYFADKAFNRFPQAAQSNVSAAQKSR